MAHHGEGGRTPDIFVKCGYFYAFLISQLFSKMADSRDFRSSDFGL